MFRRTLAALSAAIGLVVVSAAIAQAPPDERPSNSGSLSVFIRGESAPTTYQSAFQAYRPFKEDQVGWREANEEVDRIGGWKAYAKEASQSGDAPATDNKKTAPADPHAGHH
ncbi:MAG TPA: hypothetical protein VJU83_12035 [Burkholderiales bacterium]|nr:hypothetical protein [Burkholderiales bacterium]